MKKEKQTPSLRQWEEMSQRLLTILQSDGSQNHKATAFLSFFWSLSNQPQPQRFASYFSEYRHWCVSLSAQLPSCGWEPTQYEKWLTLLQIFRNHTDAIHHDELVHVEKQIRLKACLAFLYVGEIEEACKVLQWQIDCRSDDINSELEQAEKMVNMGLQYAQPFADDLQLAVAHWKEEWQGYRPDALAAVVVDQTQALAQPDIHPALIIDLHTVAHLRTKDAEEDRVLLNNNVRFGKDSIYWALLDAVRAARRLAAARISLQRYFTFEFSLPEKEASFSGTSIGLAAAISAYTQLVNSHYQTTVGRMAQHAAVTGGIKPDGAIDAVDEEGLAAKIETVFFSSKRRLFIPAANLTSALQQLTRWQKRYPKRKLTIHGVDTLQQALHDQNLIHQRPITPLVKTTATIRKLKYKKSLLAAVLLMLLILLFRQNPGWHWWRDKNPSQLNVIGSQFIVLNKDGEELWRYDFGHRMERALYINDNNLVKFCDLNGNGLNEILVGTHESGSSQLSGILFCFSDRGVLLWRYKPGRAMTFGSERFSDHYQIHYIQTVKLFADKSETYILVNAHHLQYYPNVLTLLGADGRFIGEYWNSGILESFLVEDLNNDGRMEILAGGYNNETGRAVLMVLDPFNMRGASPQDTNGNYIARGLSPGSQWYYLRFPPSILSTRRIRDCAFDLKTVDDDIQVHIMNTALYQPPRPVEHSGIYEYYLDHDMRVKAFHVNDPYVQRHIELTGRPFDAKEIQRLCKLEYWEGGKWVEK